MAFCCDEAADFAVVSALLADPDDDPAAPDEDDDADAVEDTEDAACDEPPEFCTCASCASSDLISALSLSMAVVVASLDDDEPPPPPPPPPPDFFALEVELVDEVDEVEEVLPDAALAELLSVLLVFDAVFEDAFDWVDGFEPVVPV